MPIALGHLPPVAQRVSRRLVGRALDQRFDVPDHRREQRVDRRRAPGQPHQIMVATLEMAPLVGDRRGVPAGVERDAHPGGDHDPRRPGGERVDALSRHQHDLWVDTVSWPALGACWKAD
nr:hypothetical protein [Actinophytocola sp.]